MPAPSPVLPPSPVPPVPPSLLTRTQRSERTTATESPSMGGVAHLRTSSNEHHPTGRTTAGTVVVNAEARSEDDRLRPTRSGGRPKARGPVQRPRNPGGCHGLDPPSALTAPTTQKRLDP